MKQYFSLCLGLFCMFLSGCKYANKEEAVVVNKEFSITVFDYLKSTDDLLEGAPFQYKNKFRNLYLVAFSSQKDSAFFTFYNGQLNRIKSVLNKPLVTDSQTVEVSGAKGVYTELYGGMQNENIYYSFLTIDAPQKYYQVCMWTRGEERKLKYKDEIEKMVLSFKLLKP